MVARFTITAAGRSRVYELLDEQVTAGRSDDNGIRLLAEGVADVHLRVARHGGQVSVEAIDGADARVNGEALRGRRVLAPGDRVQLPGGVVLEFATAPGAVAPAPPPPPPPAKARPSPVEVVVPSARAEARARQERRRAGPRTAGPAAGRRPGRGRASATPPWHVISLGVAIGVVALVALLRLADSPAMGQSADDLLELAEAQLSRGNPTRARQTLELARARAAADPALQRRLADLDGRVQRYFALQADSATLSAAAEELQALREFERIHLREDPGSPPASRTFLELIDRWRERYAETCARHESARAQVAEVDDLRARYLAAAHLDQPETGADVLFAAERYLRLRRPRFRVAAERLDAFLARGGDDPSLAAVRQLRESLPERSRDWVARREEVLRREWARGRFDAVLEELELVASECALGDDVARLEELMLRWRREAGR